MLSTSSQSKKIADGDFKKFKTWRMDDSYWVLGGHLVNISFSFYKNLRWSSVKQVVYLKYLTRRSDLRNLFWQAYDCTYPFS